MRVPIVTFISVLLLFELQNDNKDEKLFYY